MNERNDRANTESAERDVPGAIREAWDGLGAVEPPALVDQAVRNRARAALRPGRSGRPWSVGWVHGLATAGLIVLGLGVLLQLREPASVGPLPPPASSSRPGPSAESAADAGRARAERALPARERLESTVADGASGFGDNAAGATGEALGESAPAAPEPAAAERQRAPLMKDARPAEDATDSTMGSRTADDDPRDPEAWLEDIRSLLDAGDRDAARASLAAFREAWPDYPVPPELDP